MNVMCSLLDSLQPSVKRWIQANFPAPVPRTCTRQLPNRPALYLYTCKRQHSHFGLSYSFADIDIQGSKFDVLYVGETERLRDRHNQHMQQVGTCRVHTLRRLICGVLPHKPCATVRDCDLQSEIFKNAVARGPHKQTDLKDSIGWSLVSSLSWVECADVPARVRAEKALIATLAPPLNWLGR